MAQNYRTATVAITALTALAWLVAVVFGATVTLKDEDGKKVKYQLVGQVEADANQGRISFNSPLGRALIGRHVGEDVEVSTPSGDRYYQIKKIEFV